MIVVKVDSKVVMAAMERLSSATANPRSALLAIGDSLVLSTKKRFETSTAPDGTRWAPNTPTTLKRKKGDKPLINEHILASQIFPDYQENTLFVGSTMKYAAMQQLGGITSPRSMFPGKVITARPFLGISADDEKMIVNTVSEYLTNVIGK